MNVIYFLTIFIGIQLLVFHVLALVFQLYSVVWWYDIMMHVLGGVWLVFVVYSLVQLEQVKAQYYAPRVLIAVGLMGFVVWELFGIYLTGGLKSDWLLDTALDTVCGIVGIVVGHYIIERLKQLV